MRILLRAVSSSLAALVLAAPVVLGLSPASAAPRQPVVYDALGDSYASGYGVPPYGACGRSDSAYAVQLDGRMRINLDADTDLVSLTIGGNDIGWSSAVVACLGGTAQQCAGSLALTRGRILTQLPGLLDTVYADVAAGAPGAHVVVTGYPRLFSPEYGAFLAASPEEQQALNDGADTLNAVIAAAAARHGFQFVDVTSRFVDHGVNSPDPWLLGPFDPGAFHPNARGYQAYTAALTAAIVPARLR